MIGWVAGILLLFAFSASAESAHVLYMLECQGCHLADGTGSPGKGVPRLEGHVARFLTVEGGREYLVRVPGAAQAPLDDVELARVLNWMLRVFGPAEIASAHPAFTAKEVGAWRERPLIDVEAARQALLRKLD